MQPKNLKRLLRALEREGLEVTYCDRIYSVRWQNSPDAPIAEVLLPENFPVEAKALKQLANLANVSHPEGGCTCRVCATPDFHPGDAGIAIGSVIETEGQVIPAAVGSDINCGMRLREIYGEIEAPLIYDLPHNITLPEDRGWVTRKGACPAYENQPVIIPGSMGAASYLMVGKDNDAFCRSASHGAGRVRSRFDLTRRGTSHNEKDLGLTGVDCITLREERRIEEAPAAYKPIESVIDVQVEAKMVDLVARLSPVLTFKT